MRACLASRSNSLYIMVYRTPRKKLRQLEISHFHKFDFAVQDLLWVFSFYFSINQSIWSKFRKTSNTNPEKVQRWLMVIFKSIFVIKNWFSFSTSFFGICCTESNLEPLKRCGTFHFDLICALVFPLWTSTFVTLKIEKMCFCSCDISAPPGLTGLVYFGSIYPGIKIFLLNLCPSSITGA